MAKDDPETLVLLDGVVAHNQGKRNGFVDNINKVKRPDGTSQSHAIRKLKKDRPDLLEKVVEVELLETAPTHVASTR
jgi:hypothetical protein